VIGGQLGAAGAACGDRWLLVACAALICWPDLLALSLGFNKHPQNDFKHPRTGLLSLGNGRVA
jgi:hypothetical protein